MKNSTRMHPQSKQADTNTFDIVKIQVWSSWYDFLIVSVKCNNLKTYDMSARVRVVSFVSIFFMGLAMYPYIAHLAAMPNKLGMSEQEYFIVQQADGSWLDSGILICLALLSTIILSILARENNRVFRFALGSVFCIGVSFVVFYMFALPAIQVTDDWTVGSPYWEILRTQWEYSQAFNAFLYIFAEILIVLAVLSWPVKEEFRGHAV